MKVFEKVKDKAFEPIELTITIESEEELIFLWHNLNVNLRSSAYNEAYWKEDYCKEYYHHSMILWDIIDQKIDQLNLRKKVSDE